MNNPFKNPFGVVETDHEMILKLMDLIDGLTADIEAMEHRMTELEREAFGKVSKKV